LRLRRDFRCRRPCRPGESAHRRLIAFARGAAFAAALTRLGTDDGRLDHDVVRAADHDQVLDIVAPYDDELALPVDLERIDDAEPLLPAAPARQLDAAAEDDAEQDENQGHADQEAYRRQDEGERSVLSENTQELHVLNSLGSAAKRIKLP
jgi:hypothetical protein